MFLIPGLVALFTFIYLRPQEVFDLMRPVSLAWMVGIVALGYLVDARIGVSRPRGSPLLTWLLALFFLCLVTIAVKAPLRIAEQLVVLVPSLLAFVFVSQGLQSLRAIGVAAGALTVLTLILAVVGIHQGLSPSACYLVGGTPDAPALETLDGRLCTTAEQCRAGVPLYVWFLGD